MTARPQRPAAPASPPTSPAPSSSSSALEAAWKIHQAQSDWTSRVDAKAAFAFTLESAGITVAIALTTGGRIFSLLDTWWLHAMHGAGIFLLLCAAGLAALVVIPRLRTRKLKQEAPTNFIYFGHLRRWRPQDLEQTLRNDDLLPQLSRQIVNMAGIAWTKHVRVQWSFSLAIAGGVLLVIPAAILAY